MEYLNVQEKWVNGKGQRNTVKITRGKAIKKVETLGAKGRVLRSKTRKLKMAEKQAILKGAFVPGLWKNCRVGTCTRRRSQKGSGLLNTIFCRGAKCAETPGNQGQITTKNPSFIQPLLQSGVKNIRTQVVEDYKKMENNSIDMDKIIRDLSTKYNIPDDTVMNYIIEHVTSEAHTVIASVNRTSDEIAGIGQRTPEEEANIYAQLNVMMANRAPSPAPAPAPAPVQVPTVHHTIDPALAAEFKALDAMTYNWK
jgi:hypothetical protein